MVWNCYNINFYTGEHAQKYLPATLRFAGGGIQKHIIIIYECSIKTNKHIKPAGQNFMHSWPSLLLTVFMHIDIIDSFTGIMLDTAFVLL